MKIKIYIGSFFLLMLSAINVNLFAQSRDFVQEDLVKVAGVTSGQAVFSLPPTDRITTRVYMDGLGRPIQRVAISASPTQKDIIMPMAYNALGQQARSYLPYASATNTGAMRSNALTEQLGFYATAGQKHATDGSPFSAQLFENSPLQKVMQSGSDGAGYQPGERYKSFDYRTNISSETIRRWNALGTAESSYGAGKLMVTSASDEQGGQTIAYTDSRGQLILKKQYLNEGGRTYIETYYVYDDA
ncbi:MAG: hypothetical protein EOO88_62120, partial [Pedobacter sp.]